MPLCDHISPSDQYDDNDPLQEDQDSKEPPKNLELYDDEDEDEEEQEEEKEEQVLAKKALARASRYFNCSVIGDIATIHNLSIF